MSRWVWNQSQNALEKATESHCWTNPPFSATMFFLCHYLHIHSTTKLMFLPSNGIVSSFQSLIIPLVFSSCRLFSEVESYLSRAIKEKVWTCFDYISQIIHKKAWLPWSVCLTYNAQATISYFCGWTKVCWVMTPVTGISRFFSKLFLQSTYFFKRC